VATQSIYVAASGNDNSTGTATFPIKTLTRASALLSQLSTGDVAYVYLKGGETFTGQLESTGNANFDVYVTTYDNATNKYATLSNTANPTQDVIKFNNKRYVVLSNLKIVQSSGSACVGSRGVNVYCSASYTGTNDRTILRITDCEITGGDYGIHTQNCVVDLNSVVCKYSWTRGISITAQTPTVRGRVSGTDIASDRFVFRCADNHVEKIGVSDGGSSPTTNASMDGGMYFSGYVFDKTSATGPSFIYTTRIIDCKYGIQIVSPNISGSTLQSLVFKRFFIKNNASHGALVKVTTAAGGGQGGNISFVDTLFSSTGDISETGAIYASCYLASLINCSIVVNHSTSGKYAVDLQSSLASLYNNIVSATNATAKLVRRKLNCTVTANYNLFVASTTSGTSFTNVTTDVNFAGWQSVSGDAASTIVASGSSPFSSASSFSSPSDFIVLQNTPAALTDGTPTVFTSPSIDAYGGSTPSDYFGYVRSTDSGYWDKGAVDRVDANRQNLYLSGNYVKLGPTINHGIATVASLAQTPESRNIHLKQHYVEGVVVSTLGVDSIGIWGLGGRAGISGFSAVPLQYAQSPVTPRQVANTPLIRPYNFSPTTAAVSGNQLLEWDIGNTPGLNDNRRVTFTLERSNLAGTSISTFQTPRLRIKLVNSGETLIDLVSEGTPIQPIYDTSIKLKLAIRYTGVRKYNEYTSSLDYIYDFRCYIDDAEVIAAPDVVMPQEWIEGVGLDYGYGPAVWAGITGRTFSPNVVSVANMGWGDFTGVLDESSPVLTQESSFARAKEYMADLDATINRVSNGGFTRYPKQQKPLVVKIPSLPGNAPVALSGVVRVPVHVVLAVQIGYTNNQSGFSTPDYLNRVKNILSSFVTSLDSSAYYDKVIVTILGYYGANAASSAPYDDTLGKCRILSPRLSAGFTNQVDDFSPFIPNITPGLSITGLDVSVAEQGLRQNSRLLTVVSPARSGVLFNNVSKQTILDNIAAIQSTGRGSGPHFVGPVAARCYEAGAIVSTSAGFRQVTAEKKLVFFICDNRGPIPEDVLYSNPDTIGFSRSKNNSRRRGPIIQAAAELKNIDISRAGVVVAGAIESPGTPSPASSYTIRESLRGWGDLLKRRGGSSLLNNPRAATPPTDLYMRSLSKLGLPYNATNPWLDPFLLNLSAVDKPTTYSGTTALPLPFSTDAEKLAAATQIGTDLSSEVKRWCDVVALPNITSITQQTLYENPVVVAETDDTAGIVFSVSESEDGEFPITPWKVYGSEGLIEIIPSDGDVTYYSPDGGNMVRVTFVTTGIINLKQNIIDVKPLRGRDVCISLTLRKFNGSVQVVTSLSIDGQITQLGSDSSAHAGECGRFSYNYKIPVSAKSVDLLIQLNGKATQSAGISAISLAAGAVSGAKPFTESDSDIAIPSGTVIMSVGTACPPGFTRVPDTTGRLAFGTTDNPSLFERRITNVAQENVITDPEFRYVDVILVLDMGGVSQFYPAMDKMLDQLKLWSPSRVRFRVIHVNSGIANEHEIFSTIRPLSRPLLGGQSRIQLGMEKVVSELNSLPLSSRKIIIYTVSPVSQSRDTIITSFETIMQSSVANISDVSILALNYSAVPVQDAGYSQLVYPSESAIPPGAVYPIFGGAPGPLPLHSFDINSPSLGDYAASIVNSMIGRQLRLIGVSAFTDTVEFNDLGGQLYHDHTSEFLADQSVVTAGPSIYDSDGFEPPIADVASGIEVLTNTTGTVPKKDLNYIKPYPFGRYSDKGNPEDTPVVAIGPSHVHNVQTDMLALPPSFQVIFCRRV
jgi:hypothetical protein